MCCTIHVEPLDRDTAIATLTIGQFVAQTPNVYVRELPTEGTTVRADLSNPAYLSLSIMPAISVFAHHEHKRQAAGVYLEIAAKYGEKVGGMITQLSNVGECAADGQRQKVLASYPGIPMHFDAVCVGFQALFLTEQPEPVV